MRRQSSTTQEERTFSAISMPKAPPDGSEARDPDLITLFDPISPFSLSEAIQDDEDTNDIENRLDALRDNEPRHKKPTTPPDLFDSFDLFTPFAANQTA